jgi:hypothetical protein
VGGSRLPSELTGRRGLEVSTVARVDVEALAHNSRRTEAMRALVGGVTATEMRTVELSDEVFDGLVRGTRHTNPVVRWWSVQLLDHCPDEQATMALIPLFDDPQTGRGLGDGDGFKGASERRSSGNGRAGSGVVSRGRR